MSLDINRRAYGARDLRAVVRTARIEDGPEIPLVSFSIEPGKLVAGSGVHVVVHGQIVGPLEMVIPQGEALEYVRRLHIRSLSYAWWRTRPRSQTPRKSRSGPRRRR